MAAHLFELDPSLFTDTLVLLLTQKTISEVKSLENFVNTCCRSSLASADLILGWRVWRLGNVHIDHPEPPI